MKLLKILFILGLCFSVVTVNNIDDYPEPLKQGEYNE